MTDLDAVRRTLRSRCNTIRGDDAQEVVGQRLRAGGLEMVSRVETGWRVSRVRGKIVGASPMGKVPDVSPTVTWQLSVEHDCIHTVPAGQFCAGVAGEAA